MATMLLPQGRVQEALSLYEQSLQVSQQLGEMRSVSATQSGIANVFVQQGKIEEALSLYEQSLQIRQQLGDVRRVAATRFVIAQAFVRQGKTQDALSLYEQSLQIHQQLGDVREVAVTQHAVAQVFVQQGKVQDALSLYEQSLETYQQLGDVREVAIAQADIGLLLMQEGKHQRALSLTWDAYKKLVAFHLDHDAQAAQEILTLLKTHILGRELFDQIWQQAVGEAQPEWLCDVQSNGESAEDIPFVPSNEEARQALDSYLTTTDRSAARHILETQQALLFQPEIERFLEWFIEQIRSQGDQRKTRYHEQYLRLLRACKSRGIASAFEELKAEDTPFVPSEEERQALDSYLYTDDWDTTRHVLETRQALLFQPQIERFLERLIEYGHSQGNQRNTRHYKQHLTLIRACKSLRCCS